jgi:signal peptidase
VVVSGSMAPQVDVGDVVLTRSVSTAELRPGQVLLFDDPQRPGRLLLHRLVSFDASGRLVTRGDANQSDDSVHVAPSDVRGLARVRVPYVGLPAQWRLEGRFGAIALTAAALAGAAAFVAGGLGPVGAVIRAAEPRRAGGRHSSRESAGPPMRGGRPPAVGLEDGPTTGRGRHRATTTAGQQFPSPVPAGRPGDDRRWGVARGPGHRLGRVAGSAHHLSGGQLCDQPGR